jgi:hypothetical protein
MACERGHLKGTLVELAVDDYLGGLGTMKAQWFAEKYSDNMGSSSQCTIVH